MATAGRVSVSPRRRHSRTTVFTQLSNSSQRRVRWLAVKFRYPSLSRWALCSSRSSFMALEPSVLNSHKV